MYVLYKLKHTYISKTQQVHKDICMKARGSKRMYMYKNSLDKTDIYMKLNINTWKTWISWKAKFPLKQISFQGICMFRQHKKYTYISLNTIESIYIDMHERQMTQGVYMYILKFAKINIYMKWKHMIITQIQNGNTSLKM